MTAARFPWVTAAVAGAALLAWMVPGSGEALEYDRGAVLRGEVWRVLTGQLVHWTPRMIVADLSVLVIAGVWLELRSRRLLVLTLAAGAVMIGLGLHLMAPDPWRYRGSSGLASALFAAAAADLAMGSPHKSARAAGLALLSLFVAKVCLEAWLGRALAAGSFPPGIEVAPPAHVLGALAGLLACALTASPDFSPGVAGPPSE